MADFADMLGDESDEPTKVKPIDEKSNKEKPK